MGLNIIARLQLKGIGDIKKSLIDPLNAQLKNIKATVQVEISSKSLAGLTRLNNRLEKTNQLLIAISKSADDAQKVLAGFGSIRGRGGATSPTFVNKIGGVSTSRPTGKMNIIIPEDFQKEAARQARRIARVDAAKSKKVFTETTKALADIDEITKSGQVTVSQARRITRSGLAHLIQNPERLFSKVDFTNKKVSEALKQIQDYADGLIKLSKKRAKEIQDLGLGKELEQARKTAFANQSNPKRPSSAQRQQNLIQQIGTDLVTKFRQTGQLSPREFSLLQKLGRFRGQFTKRDDPNFIRAADEGFVQRIDLKTGRRGSIVRGQDVVVAEQARQAAKDQKEIAKQQVSLERRRKRETERALADIEEFNRTGKISSRGFARVQKVGLFDQLDPGRLQSPINPLTSLKQTVGVLQRGGRIPQSGFASVQAAAAAGLIDTSGLSSRIAPGTGLQGSVGFANQAQKSFVDKVGAKLDARQSARVKKSTERALGFIDDFNKTGRLSQGRLEKIQQAGLTDQLGTEGLASKINPRTGRQGPIVRTSSELEDTRKNLKDMTQGMKEFGDQTLLATRRFLAFTAGTSTLLAFSFAIKKSISDAIDFEREIIKVAQVTDTSIPSALKLGTAIRKLGVELGVNGNELAAVTTTLAQAGIKGRDLEQTLTAIAKSSLSPTFTSMEDTANGLIAAFSQFGLKGKDAESTLETINSISAAFAVESDDLITAISKAGGAFRAATPEFVSGQDALKELLAVFTSVRATTREGADTIATGLRTIVSRLQDAKVEKFLEDTLNVDLRDTKGQFVGVLDAINRISDALKKRPSTDPLFAEVVKQIGGLRNQSKVVPLLQQTDLAKRALVEAELGAGSLESNAGKALQGLGQQIQQVVEEFARLGDKIVQDRGFRRLIDHAKDLTSVLVSLSDVIIPLIPAITAFSALQIVKLGARTLQSFGIGESLNKFAGGFSQLVPRRASPTALPGPVPQQFGPSKNQFLFAQAQQQIQLQLSQGLIGQKTAGALLQNAGARFGVPNASTSGGLSQATFQFIASAKKASGSFNRLSALIDKASGELSKNKGALAVGGGIIAASLVIGNEDSIAKGLGNGVKANTFAGGLSGAAQGLLLGSVLGPFGAAIGALTGGLLGAANAAKEFASKAAAAKANEAVSQFSALSDLPDTIKTKQLRRDAARTAVIEKLREAAAIGDEGPGLITFDRNVDSWNAEKEGRIRAALSEAREPGRFLIQDIQSRLLSGKISQQQATEEVLPVLKLLRQLGGKDTGITPETILGTAQKSKETRELSKVTGDLIQKFSILVDSLDRVDESFNQARNSLALLSGKGVGALQLTRTNKQGLINQISPEAGRLNKASEFFKDNIQDIIKTAINETNNIEKTTGQPATEIEFQNAFEGAIQKGLSGILSDKEARSFAGLASLNLKPDDFEKFLENANGNLRGESKEFVDSTVKDIDKFGQELEKIAVSQLKEFADNLEENSRQLERIRALEEKSIDARIRVEDLQTERSPLQSALARRAAIQGNFGSDPGVIASNIRDLQARQKTAVNTLGVARTQEDQTRIRTQIQGFRDSIDLAERALKNLAESTDVLNALEKERADAENGVLSFLEKTQGEQRKFLEGVSKGLDLLNRGGKLTDLNGSDQRLIISSLKSAGDTKFGGIEASTILSRLAENQFPQLGGLRQRSVQEAQRIQRANEAQLLLERERNADFNKGFQSLNKDQARGLAAAAKQAGLTPDQALAAGAAQFNNAVALFDGAVQNLAKAFEKLPDSIEIGGNLNVNVNHNGHQVFEQMLPAFKELLVTEVTHAFQKFSQNRLKGSGPPPTRDQLFS